MTGVRSPVYPPPTLFSQLWKKSPLAVFAAVSLSFFFAAIKKLPEGGYEAIYGIILVPTPQWPGNETQLWSDVLHQQVLIDKGDIYQLLCIKRHDFPISYN